MKKYIGFKVGDLIKFSTEPDSSWKIITYNDKLPSQEIELVKGHWGGYRIGDRGKGTVSNFTCFVISRKGSNKPYYPEWF